MTKDKGLLDKGLLDKGQRTNDNHIFPECGRVMATDKVLGKMGWKILIGKMRSPGGWRWLSSSAGC